MLLSQIAYSKECFFFRSSYFWDVLCSALWSALARAAGKPGGAEFFDDYLYSALSCISIFIPILTVRCKKPKQTEATTQLSHASHLFFLAPRRSCRKTYRGRVTFVLVRNNSKYVATARKHGYRDDSVRVDIARRGAMIRRGRNEMSANEKGEVE